MWQAEQGKIPVIAGGRMPAYYHNEANINPPVITVSGSGAYAGYVNFFNVPIYASDCSTIQPNNKFVSLSYVYNFLKNKQQDIYELKQGGAQPHVYAKNLRGVDIFLPPLTEQKRIVAKLDKQLAAVEQARQTAEKRLADIKLLLAALLREAFPAGKKLPKGWKWIKLEEVCEKVNNIKFKNCPESDFLYVDVSAVSKDTLSIVKTQTINSKSAPSRARILIKEYDVLFATVRPALRRVAIVPQFLDGHICSTGYVVLRSKNCINYQYLFYYLITDRFVDSMERLQTGISYPAVTDRQVKEQLIPLPPLPEQKRIIAKLDKQLAAAKQKQQTAEQQLADINLLPNALLREALTP